MLHFALSEVAVALGAGADWQRTTVRAIDETAVVQQFQVAADGDFRTAVLLGKLSHQGPAVLVDKINDGAAPLLVQSRAAFVDHGRIRAYSSKNTIPITELRVSASPP